MATEKKGQEEKEKEDLEMVKFTNGMLYAFQSGPGMKKVLAASEGISGADRHKMFVLIRTINESVQMKAFGDSMNEIATKFAKAQEPIPIEKRNALTIFYPAIQELFATDTGFEVKKLKLNLKELPEGVSAVDAAEVAWLIEL